MATVKLDSVLEIAIFDVNAGTQETFEEALREVGKIVSKQPGYIDHSARKCYEIETRYTLLVEWQSVEDHVERFARTQDARNCRTLLREFLTGADAQHYVEF